VEIDQWFWSYFGPDKVVLPKPAVVQDYVDSTPKDFRFSIKVPNSLTLTHGYRKQKTDPLVPNAWYLSPELFKRFLESVEPLLPRVGVLLFQFEYLNREKLPGGLDTWLNSLQQFAESCESPVPVCLEPRNPQFLKEPYFKRLAEMSWGHVFNQGYYLPDIVDVYRKAYKLLKGTQVVRLLGPDREGIEKRTGKIWDQRSEPRDEELAIISRMVRHMLRDQGLDLYLNVNNHYEGSAPHTIRNLEALLKGEEASKS
jgi:uncharacterized protein YecE (DUF72 family)